MILKILDIFLLSFLSRVHGDSNNTGKILEGLVFAIAAVTSFIEYKDYDVTWYGYLLAIVVVAIGKNMGHRNGLLMIRGPGYTIKGLWAFISKGAVMSLPFILLSLFNDDLQNVIRINMLLPFHLLVAYDICRRLAWFMKWDNKGTDKAEYLSGALMGGILWI